MYVIFFAAFSGDDMVMIQGGGVVSPGVPVDHLLFGGGDALIESIESVPTAMVTCGGEGFGQRKNLELAAGIMAQVVKTVMSRPVEVYRREERVAGPSLSNSAPQRRFLVRFGGCELTQGGVGAGGGVRGEEDGGTVVDVDKVVLAKARS